MIRFILGKYSIQRNMEKVCCGLNQDISMRGNLIIIENMDLGWNYSHKNPVIVEVI